VRPKLLITMNRKYDYYAYCSHCQRWILKTALVSNSLGAQTCPYCHSRVRIERHLHDIPGMSRLVFDKAAENSVRASGRTLRSDSEKHWSYDSRSIQRTRAHEGRVLRHSDSKRKWKEIPKVQPSANMGNRVSTFINWRTGWTSETEFAFSLKLTVEMWSARWIHCFLKNPL
jgi:hypothetical protein